MTSKRVLLQRAEEQFLKKNYRDALKIYGLLLKDYPQFKDAKVGAYLSDMGLDLDDDAQALFDYYQAIKDSNDDAEAIIDELTQTIYATRFIVHEQIMDAIKESEEYGNNISYDDFIKLVEDKGDFREAFENIMFSTKVLISTKDEFKDFIHRLVDAGFQSIALKYLDSLVGQFNSSQDMYELYDLIDKEYK